MNINNTELIFSITEKNVIKKRIMLKATLLALVIVDLTIFIGILMIKFVK